MEKIYSNLLIPSRFVYNSTETIYNLLRGIYVYFIAPPSKIVNYLCDRKMFPTNSIEIREAHIPCTKHFPYRDRSSTHSMYKTYLPIEIGEAHIPYSRHISHKT
jgi:hypothetical protein